MEERHLEDGDEEEATTTESGSAAGTGSRRATGTDDEEDDYDDYGAVNPTRDALQVRQRNNRLRIGSST